MNATLVSSPPVLATGNWVWLLAPPRQERAIVVAPEGDTLARVLSPHFPAIRRVTSPGGTSPRIDDESADLIAISRLESSVAAGHDVASLVRDCRRALRPGGCLLVTFANPLWARRLRQGPGSPGHVGRRRVLRALAGAGFERIASYYLQPYPEAAGSIIPIWAPAAEHHERMQHISSRIGRLRPLFARLGGHGLLYPGCACVGYV